MFAQTQTENRAKNRATNEMCREGEKKTQIHLYEEEDKRNRNTHKIQAAFDVISVRKMAYSILALKRQPNPYRRMISSIGHNENTNKRSFFS